MRRVHVKICCIQSLNEAETAVKYGASAIGLVSEMPSGPGVISEEQISKIAGQVPAGIKTFLLTSKLNAGEIIAQLKKCKTSTVQLVDSVELNVYKSLRKELPNLEIVQAIHVSGDDSVKEALRIEKYVDAILLDSGNQKLEVKELGGTGRTHDWNLSKKIVDSVSVPVYLAGGLNPSNVKQAIEEVNPFGLDLCSGVRTEGRLDEKKLDNFFERLT